MKQAKLLVALRVVCMAVLLVSVISLIRIGIGYWKSDRLRAQAQQDFLLPPKIAETASEPQAPKPEEIVVPQLPPQVDFDALEAANSDAVGWLWIGGTEISYPLLQTDDNARYLNTAYDGSRSAAGSIFLDYRNAADFSDDNTILYGHNMKNRSMFGSLKQFRQQVFADEHSEIYILMRSGTLKYKVFAAYEVSAEDPVSYARSFDSESAQAEALARAARRSSIVMAETPATGVRLLTLSTCTASDKNRLVVQAYLKSE